MTQTAEELPIPDFEIDHKDEFPQYLLSNRREILYYLNNLATRHSLLTAYINEGQRFLLTSIVAVDDASSSIFFDPPNVEEQLSDAMSARQITLVTNLDRVQIQMRLPALTESQYQGKKAMYAPIPEAMLRLQRREFFRLEPPLSTPIHCKLVARSPAGRSNTLDLALSDISGGGISLIAPTEIADHFPRDTLFQQCRLEIPGEGVIQVNLRVRKTIELSSRNGHHSLRVGCEFIDLPSNRLAFVERYITRIERERKAKDSGLD